MRDLRTTVQAGVIAVIAASASVLWTVWFPSKPQYIHVQDQNIDYMLNVSKIRWIRQHWDCFYICTKSNGCIMTPTYTNAPKVCKDMADYNKVKDLIADPWVSSVWQSELI